MNIARVIRIMAAAVAFAGLFVVSADAVGQRDQSSGSAGDRAQITAILGRWEDASVVANILAGVIGSYPLERELIVAHCEGTGGNGDRETGTGPPSHEIASRQDLFAARAKLSAESRVVPFGSIHPVGLCGG